MLTEKCRQQRKGTEETEQLRLLLSQLEQNFQNLQKDTQTLRRAGAGWKSVWGCLCLELQGLDYQTS